MIKVKDIVIELSDDLYAAVTFPEVQEFMEVEGFKDNSHLINDEDGINKYGSSAYMVNCNWIMKHGLYKD